MCVVIFDGDDRGWMNEVEGYIYYKIIKCIFFLLIITEICQRRSTSMISNDTESQSEYSISQYY